MKMHRKTAWKKWQQRGDTIVEVMIVLTVLASAISLAYATANRSLRNARQAQDNSYATSLAKAQVEQLRAYANAESTNPNYIYNNELFCFDATGNVRKFSPAVTPAERVDNSKYPPGCITTHSQTFYISIDYNSQQAFEIKVYWDDAGQVATGSTVDDTAVAVGKASTTLIYRVFPES